MLHTEKYAFAETEEGLTIDIKYVLYDDSGNGDISGEQEIRVLLADN